MPRHSTDKKIAYYITPHGFGHAVRSMEIIRSLLDHDAQLQIILVSDLPDFLVAQYLGSAVRVRKRRLDVGLVQQDSLQFDLEATLRAVQLLYQRRATLVAEEVQFLKRERVGVVVSDVAFLPFPAAAECGIPAVGVGNFTWDWIYQTYADRDPRWLPLLDWIRAAYGSCNQFLQLPMHGDCSACAPITDVPLVTRKARNRPEQTRRSLGCSAAQKLYLMAFAALDLDQAALARLERLNDAVLLYKHPLHYDLKNGKSLDGYEFLSYPDVVAAVDGVITKPGYGIVADCLAHGTPMIYTDRGFFPEYEILVRAMERHLTTVYLSSENLYTGCWGPTVSQLERLARRFPKLRNDGAAVCAETILKLVEQAGKEPIVTKQDSRRDTPAGEAKHPPDVVVMPIEDSLDLHTFQPREVKDLLQDYLEAAQAKRFPQVLIIHGKGTGTLRATVHAILQKHPLVAFFKQADEARGGWGATLVTLRSRAESSKD